MRSGTGGRVPDALALAITAALAVIVAAASSLAAKDGAEKDPWSAFLPLVGTWQGEGRSSGAVSTVAHVTHHWEFTLQGKFLKLDTRSTSARPDGTEEVHEDTGFVSRDTDHGTFVFRQFLSEGYVNTFTVRAQGTKEGQEIVFDPRESESAGGMRARMRLVFRSADEYEFVLELAAPGGDFAPCQRVTMKRVR
jgi:hypothetical protein